MKQNKKGYAARGIFLTLIHVAIAGIVLGILLLVSFLCQPIIMGTAGE